MAALWSQGRSIASDRLAAMSCTQSPKLSTSTDLPVAKVAAQVGCDDPSQLAAAILKALGVSPSQHRRKGRS